MNPHEIRTFNALAALAEAPLGPLVRQYLLATAGDDERLSLDDIQRLAIACVTPLLSLRRIDAATVLAVALASAVRSIWGGRARLPHLSKSARRIFVRCEAPETARKATCIEPKRLPEGLTWLR